MMNNSALYDKLDFVQYGLERGFLLEAGELQDEHQMVCMVRGAAETPSLKRSDNVRSQMKHQFLNLLLACLKIARYGHQLPVTRVRRLLAPIATFEIKRTLAVAAKQCS